MFVGKETGTPHLATVVQSGKGGLTKQDAALVHRTLFHTKWVEKASATSTSRAFGKLKVHHQGKLRIYSGYPYKRDTMHVFLMKASC